MHRRLTYFASGIALFFAVTVPLACDGGGGDAVDTPVCGDGVMEGDEECDGDDVGGQFCSDVNPLFVGGYLVCLDTCVIDVAHCELPECGDNNAQGYEECDGYDMGDHADCKDHGFRCGYTTCNTDDCTLNTDDCTLEVRCDTVDLTLQSESAIGGLAQGGSEYSYIYQSVVDLGNTRTWKTQIELWGDLTGNGLSTDPVDLTLDGTGFNVYEEPYVVYLLECMDVDCDPPLKYYLPMAGTLQLSSLGEAPDGVLAGTLDAVTWKQFRINFETGDASSVECGPCYDMDSSYTLDATVDFPPQP
jgi:hypothetical protein